MRSRFKIFDFEIFEFYPSQAAGDFFIPSDRRIRNFNALSGFHPNDK
jgi:hypothetical protein